MDALTGSYANARSNLILTLTSLLESRNSETHLAAGPSDCGGENGTSVVATSIQRSVSALRGPRPDAHALSIRARAEMRLAEEYDAAQDRGEVATVGQRPNVVGDNVSTAADIGLRRDEIHEASKALMFQKETLVGKTQRDALAHLCLTFSCRPAANDCLEPNVTKSLRIPVASAAQREYFDTGN